MPPGDFMQDKSLIIRHTMIKGDMDRVIMNHHDMRYDMAIVTSFFSPLLSL